jgi:CRISPR-associated endonuclease/helicase Cas3
MTNPCGPKSRLCTDLNLHWAKIGSRQYIERHPLLWHLIDVAVVTQRLWQKALQSAVQDRISRKIKVDSAEAGRWLAFWAGSHDIGKACPGFQCRDQSGEARRQLASIGFDFPGLTSPPHGVVTTVVLGFEQAHSLLLNACSGSVRRNMATAIGGHHGLFARRSDLLSTVSNSDVLGGQAWQDVRTEMLAILGDLLEASAIIAKANPEPEDHWFFMFVAGLTSVADWIASNSDHFPHRPDVESLDEYVAIADGQAEAALDALGWTAQSDFNSDICSFTNLFPHCDPPRPLQQAVVDAVGDTSTPQFLLLEAPTGEGKTEAAFFAADRWLNIGGGQGVYVGLPTMATSTQMFERFGAFIRHRCPGERVNLHLLHSGAVLNERYEQLRRAAFANLDERPPLEVHDDTEAHGQGGLVADAWFTSSRKQAMLAPFGVGTIDQCLLSVLQVKHGFVRLFGLAGKVVILDEVHAYDVYTSTLLDHLLMWLRALGCRVVMLSATLPAARRRALLEAWMGRDCQVPPAPYPRLLMANECGVHTSTFAVSSGREARIHLSAVTEEDLPARLVQVLEHGGCAAVIRNTVRQAQEAFNLLYEVLGGHGIVIELLHARYPFEDRQSREMAVVERYGKAVDGHPDNENRPHRSVLVATQVIEQSLDLDFDVMVSDMAPIDLLLQRAGRLHRHDRPDRPMKQADLWLVEPNQDDAGVPDFGVSEWVYERAVLLRTSLLLSCRSTLRLPEETEGLIEAVYGDDPHQMLAPRDAAWEAALDAADKAARSRATDHERRARQLTIGDPQGGPDPLTQFCQQLDEENPQVHTSLQAATRLTRPSVSVVLLYRTAKGLAFTPDGTEMVDVDAAPTLAVTKRLLGRSVSLQHTGLVRALLDEPVPTKWRRSTLLRFHRLVCLDVDGNSRVGDWGIHLDDLGITITRDSPDDDHDA